MSDLARLLQQYGYGQEAPPQGETLSTSNVLAGMPKRSPLADALQVAGVPKDEHGFFFSNVGGELKFNPYEAIKSFMGYRAPPGALSTSGDDAPVRNAADAAGWLGASGLGLNFAGQVPKNSLGMFGGRLAKTADHAALARAEEMQSQGFARNDIRQATGWFQDAGGNWRFEIPDNQATATGEVGSLGKALAHPALYEAYPQLKNLPVGNLPENSPGTGAYLPKIDGVLSGILARVSGGNPSARIDVQPGSGRSTLLHETQHAVDDIEGVFKGVSRSNPYGVEGGTNLANSAAYRDAPFEKSARAVQAREDLTALERQERAPWLDYGNAASTARRAAPSPSPAPESPSLPLLPERAALEDAFRQLGMDPAKQRAAIEAMKGAWNERAAADGFTKLHNSNVDMALGRNGYEGSVVSQNPLWRDWGNAMEEYYKKAQTLGHNGGPEPSTWEDPFIYSLKR